jgi:hypothetical protein
MRFVAGWLFRTGAVGFASYRCPASGATFGYRFQRIFDVTSGARIDLFWHFAKLAT